MHNHMTFKLGKLEKKLKTIKELTNGIILKFSKGALQKKKFKKMWTCPQNLEGGVGGVVGGGVGVSQMWTTSVHISFY